MAAGALIIPNKAKLNLFSPTETLNPGNTFKLALVTSAFTPNDSDSGNEVWADVSANEIAAGAGYTAGGVVLSSVSLSQSGGTVKFTCGAAQWTANGGSIPAWRHGYIYAFGTFNGKVNPIIGHFLGDATPADIPATAAPNTLTVTPNASGLLTAA